MRARHPANRLRTFLTLLLLVMPGLEASNLYAVDLTGSLTAGYDSCPAARDDSTGSGFLGLDLGADQTLEWGGGLEPTFYLRGNYQAFERVEDDYGLAAGLSLSRPFLQGEFDPLLMAEAIAYRDDLVPADERDEGLLGLGLRWHVSDLRHLGARLTSRWMSYLNPSAPYQGLGPGSLPGGSGGLRRGPSSSYSLADTPGGTPASFQGHGEKGHHGEGQGPPDILSARDDHEIALGFDWTETLSPVVSLLLNTSLAHLHSSVTVESYDFLRAGAGVRWALYADWDLGLDAYWAGTWYAEPESPQQRGTRRVDDTIGGLLRLSHDLGQYALFWQVEWADNDSTIQWKSYSRMIAECGVSLSF